MQRENGKVNRITVCAVLVACAMALSLIERWIPPFIPVPGVKLGISNAAVLTAIYLLGGVSGAWVLAGKCLLGAIFSGSIVSAAYSIAGGILSYLVMLIAKRCRAFSPVGVSVLGSAAHVTGQIFASMALMGTTVTVAYLPVLLAVSVLTGAVIGAVTALVLRRIKRPVH